MTEVMGADMTMIAQAANTVNVHKNLSPLEPNRHAKAKLSTMESGKRKKMAVVDGEVNLQSTSQASKRSRHSSNMDLDVGQVPLASPITKGLNHDIKNNNKPKSAALTPFRPPSKTKMTQHIRKLKKAGLLNNGEALPSPHTIQHINHTPTPPKSTSSFLANTVMKLFRSGSSSCSNYTEDMDVVREIDHDVATAVVSVGGSMLGLPQEELMQSQGMRKLVARNMQWFQGSPDFIKMIGLVAAKKLNQIVQRRTPPALPSCIGLEPTNLPFKFGVQEDTEKMQPSMCSYPINFEHTPTDDDGWHTIPSIPTPLEDVTPVQEDQPVVLDMISSSKKKTAAGPSKRPKRLTIKPMQHAPVTLITEDVNPIVPFPVYHAANSSELTAAVSDADVVAEHGTA